MLFRYARHTTDLQKMENFYTKIIGLEVLGRFEDHNGYHGIFLGLKTVDWHLEFTTSATRPKSTFDDDDLLVFYVSTAIEIEIIKRYLDKHQIAIEKPKNPYWMQHGVMFSDPDGYKIVFAIRHLLFTSNDELTRLVVARGISNWSELVATVQKMPYGRNTNRSDFSLVLKENKGTCSSKHSFLKKVADLNGFGKVQLMLGMYQMHEKNTPKIGQTIQNAGLQYIPEAHCYLKMNHLRIDITHEKADFSLLAHDIMEEQEIEPEQVGIFKINYHTSFIKRWIQEQSIGMDFDTVWNIRENCIQMLEL
ncbi:VOC family protein [Flavobacterium branchiophilum]|uniref:VOC domain-containing protein n=1 Tax=Flavobacterium branchiophilum TaxID=55197 RepID=A0A2H3KLW0_9FLAO|nr:VOC family protein [Flavobacterium branchiophilum]PDS26802.1 hypothetical protein B0A77_00885 [Flavobacterium branchiophilum]